MFADLVDDGALSPADAAQVHSLDAVRAGLVAEARLWAARIAELSALSARAERAGAQVRRTLALELAGSWQVGQLTAERWVAEAERFVEALPRTLAMLGAGTLLTHQAKVLLHRLQECSPEVARAVEAQVLPAGAGLCPSDLTRQVDRVRLRVEAAQSDAEELVRQEAEKTAGRRTWLRPTPDGMAVAGALLTPEQAVSWADGMDVLERRERLADRAAGVSRTAEQRRADLFAGLPALVLAGAAADDRWRREAGGRARPQSTWRAPLLEPDGPEPPPWTFHPDRVAAQIVLNVHVPVSTVLDLAQEPAALEGYGPVSAQHVRLLRPHSVRRVMVDARSGRPVAVDDRATPAAPTAEGRRAQVQEMLRPDVVTDVDEPQHDPSARLARLIDLRDLRCGGPGCASQPLRPRPPRAVPGRCDVRPQPRTAVTPLPQRQAPRLDAPAAPGRQRHLDQPAAPPLRPTRTLGPTATGRSTGRATRPASQVREHLPPRTTGTLPCSTVTRPKRLRHRSASGTTTRPSDAQTFRNAPCARAAVSNREPATSNW